ncbi:MAG: PglZ domain-containing protein [Blastocatellia bacterium]|nr:PglZ domain-containing protein [Blastocatellia bacterium]
MQIAEFIRERIINPRLQQRGCLVVYDPERRYRDLCLRAASDTIKVIDASESGIESRMEALRALRELGNPQTSVKGLLIYVPAAKPLNDEQKQADPFALYTECGTAFPEDDGDEFPSLCLRARPDHSTEIRRVFAENPSPSFAVIDAIGGGMNWPQLRAALRVESARDILAAMLVPNAEQSKALKGQSEWAQEARDFLHATLRIQVKTRAKSWATWADEIWRFLLFSEFVFDLPGELPEALTVVPRAPDEAKPFVEDMCEQLRSDLRTRALYIEKAEAVEAELNLPEICRDIEDLGEKDTFQFEERTFLQRAIDGLLKDDADKTRQVLSRQANSVWLGKGESQGQWTLVHAALNLIEACDDFERQLPDHSRSQENLLDFYTGSLRESDRLHREFEQAVGDFFDTHGILGDVIEHARVGYRRLTEKVQTLFIKHLEARGWPPAGRLANADVYDRFVSERIKERGRKIAYFMVDALRYELGVELEKLLSEDGLVELQAAYAQLPTITPVGMASLLPGARNDLVLDNVSGSLVPKLAGVTVGNVNQRMDVFRKRLGDLFEEKTLSDFVRKKTRLAPTVELLVLRSTEIDSHLESNPETTLSLILGILKLIRAALHKLREQGFSEAVIATDHGFFLNAQAEAGDVCVKPQGNWVVNAHDRMMLGDGVADSHNFVVSAERLGIRGAFAQCAGPKSMAPYRAGHLYFHGGASLPEAVVPLLVVRLEAPKQKEKQQFKVELSYKSGAKKITTRLPVIEVELYTDYLFSQGLEIEILLEAQDEKGNVVGEPRPGGDVNPATQTITLTPGMRKQIVLRMENDFEGKFTVRALNPMTLEIYKSLILETDYTV